MTTPQIYELAVRLGIKADLRGQAKVKKYLENINKKYEKLDKEQKAEFDKEKLTNPYSDTRILVDTSVASKVDKKKEIKKILTGIDIEGTELLLADKMGDIDLVIGHHPRGKALADLHSVMDLQAQVLADYGVPINIAESIIKPRISEVSRGIASVNHNRIVDIARLLKIDFICAHTIADNLGADFLIKLLKRKRLDTVEDILKMLKEIPEFKEAVKYNAGPALFVGNPENSCGKVAVTEFTGGTSGSKEMYEKISQAGIGTIMGMHMGEEHRKEAEKNHINVVIAGHMASDSLGMNLFLDELEKKGITVVPCSGLIRVKRFLK
ncbi:NGG1p interacting factor NIF3 [Candidatus Falkowbacteria bacterium CG_4_10_14_0_2_um_filter_36_22]|uniref:NGG1p interacting factor NIF3 n=2 Tax=Candidatus Falkowiibacteriota TaxID=1752728 RepID=A0A1J4T6I5_9BACT|nr:MAG: NGG1p interacting factor NIF3 [Candidatus Falkowbacteria bacterium CG1_02_37_44]PIV50495.1 MAG: NGG1p interacting factor NIF3 [Candidatus Falkowbacteria bacterium CG02_land_8_20_14_3_00_36_14]PIX10970.1 MAG: NGG1p interacting factor NIF3 [Candidatus Falkowbacteria bacterium CG_4_8_14_3_um_filter_36_11]PJA10566.1 MAG: NGG1p interacting factor NIF3 [Candidatus Falkowbacteria bacterium CG_4_10_14_0_2_um_filter_36_22]